MVECTGLENQRGGNLSVSSNLTPSASKILFPFILGNFSKSQHFSRIISISEPISRVRTVGTSVCVRTFFKSSSCGGCSDCYN